MRKKKIHQLGQLKMDTRYFIFHRKIYRQAMYGVRIGKNRGYTFLSSVSGDFLKSRVCVATH